MIVAVTLGDGQVVAISAEHIVLLSPTEDEKKTEITLVNGKKFVMNGTVQALCNHFNHAR